MSVSPEPIFQKSFSEVPFVTVAINPGASGTGRPRGGGLVTDFKRCKKIVALRPPERPYAGATVRFIANSLSSLF
jgi:hypothetical protein